MAWKRFIRNSLLAAEYSDFLDECQHLPLANCDSIRPGKPLPHWSVTTGLPSLTRINNMRIRILVNCHCLEADVSRFRSSDGDPTCKQCGTESEDHAHFILRCPALSPARDLSPFPSNIQSLFHSDPPSFVNAVLGTTWVDDDDFQHSAILFLNSLRVARTTFSISAQ